VNEELLNRIAARLGSCPGVDAVVLGGSHTSGTADAESDFDLGLYYRAEDSFDLDTLREIVSDIDDQGRRDIVTAPGDWGPWVNGGAWIEAEGQRIDLIYRDLGRVRVVVEDCREGRVETHFQVGHPAGFSTQIYAAEVHLCRTLEDPHGTVEELKNLTWPYPAALRHALIHGLWEAQFLLESASKSAHRGDVYHVTGLAFRSLACIVHALFGLNERYWLNEKSAISLVETLPDRTEDFTRRVPMILGNLGSEPETLGWSLRALGELLDETVALCEGAT
jgi:hypothetical protein